MYVLSRIINSSKRTGYVVGVEDAREGKAMGERERMTYRSRTMSL
jgi:hypothetical protein